VHVDDRRGIVAEQPRRPQFGRQVVTAAFELAGQPTVEHDHPFRDRVDQVHESSLLVPGDAEAAEGELFAFAYRWPIWRSAFRR
jgi:hypothetical protein